MNSQLFIPSRIKVGYQRRSDTYTKRLAYIIYYDSKGKLRKERSWNTWRDDKIKPKEFDNVPHSGFVLNKGVQRYGHWGSGRNMIRVYDDRGLEFEITIDNLMFILMTTDCQKRELEGEFVYSWNGAELVLLPVGCEEYKESTDFTDLQATKVTAKDMVAGCSYTTRNQDNYIYLGRFDWYEITHKSWQHPKIMKPKKRHIFVRENGDNHDYNKKYWVATGFTTLANRNTDEPVSNFPKLMEDLSKSKHTSRPVGLVDSKKDINFDRLQKYADEDYYNKGRDKTYYKKLSDNEYQNFTIMQEKIEEYNLTSNDYTFIKIAYSVIQGDIFKFKNECLTITRNEPRFPIKFTRNQMEQQKNDFCQLYIKMDSGSKVKAENFV